MTDTTSPVAPANDALASSEEDPPIVQSVQIPTPFVVIATPSLSHSCSMHHRAAMLEIRGALLQRGIPHAIVAQGGMTYLDRVRDMLATQFLEDFPDATDLFFIDDDVGGEDLHGHLIQFLIRPEPILLGATPLKNDDSPQGATFPVRFLGDGDSGKLIHNSGMMLIDRGPMGFCRIKRAVLQAMIDGGKVLRYREPHSNRMVWHFFSQGVGDDGDGGLTYWGEDTIFIARAALMGIQTWLDPNITFFHDGRKSYRGNCLRELFRQHGKLMQPEGLVPSNVATGPSSEVPMIEYPKWVHGELAFSVEDESRLERAWQAAGGVEPIAELADTGVHPDGVAAATSVAPVPPESTAPDGVSASTPVIEDLSQLPVYQAEAIIEAASAPPEDQGLKPVMVSGPIPAVVTDEPPTTEQVQATIEADLNEAAALTVQIAAPAEQEPVTTPENTPTIPADPVAEPVEEDPPVPVAGLEQPPLAVAPPAVDSGMPAGELAAEAAGTSAPAAEPAVAQQGTEPTAPASESPGSGDTSPAAEPVEPAAPVEQVQPVALQAEPLSVDDPPVSVANPPVEEAPAVAAADTGAPAVQAADPPIETVPTATADQPQPAAEVAPVQAVDAGAAAEPVQAPEAETPPMVAAEVEQPAAASAPAPADSVAPAEVPAAATEPAAETAPTVDPATDAVSATADAQPAEIGDDAQPPAPGA